MPRLSDDIKGPQHVLRRKPLPQAPNSAIPPSRLPSIQEGTDGYQYQGYFSPRHGPVGVFADEIELQDLDQEGAAVETLEQQDQDHWGELCGDDSALLGGGTSAGYGKRGINRCRKRNTRDSYRGTRPSLRTQLPHIRDILHLSGLQRFGSSRKIGAKYNRISQASISTFISEEQFWLLLKRFFGLAPLPDWMSKEFPTDDEVSYIENYLQSQPTPTTDDKQSDHSRNMVRLCSRLTAFIFHDRESKKIFLGTNHPDRKAYRTTWQMFQGFGLIDQFCSHNKRGRKYGQERNGIAGWLQVCILHWNESPG